MRKQFLPILIFLLCFATIGYTQWSDDPSENTPVCTDPHNQHQPLITTDGDGGAIIVWNDQEYSGWYNIYAQRIDKDGYIKWDERGISICTAQWNQTVSSIVPDDSGGAYISWTDNRRSVIPWPPYMDRRDGYIQHINSEGEVLWEENGFAFADTLSTSGGKLVSDGINGVIIIWRMRGEENLRPTYAQRMSYDGTLLWDSLGILIDTLAQVGQEGAVASDGFGGVLVFRGDRTYRMTNEGELLWVTEGFGSNNMIGDGFGGALCTRSERYWNGSESVYDHWAFKVNYQGEFTWPDTGIFLNTLASSLSGRAEIVTDNDEGAYVSWTDLRSGSSEYYIQRIDSTGLFLWNDTTINGGYLMLPDDKGNVIVTFSTISSDTVYRYLKKVNGSGVSAWGDEEVLFSIRPTQSTYQLVRTSDGLGGVILAWDDLNGYYGWDIFAQYVDSSGYLGGTVSVTGKSDYIPEQYTLLQNYPNPFNDITKIVYDIPMKSEVSLTIYDAKGHEVVNLVNKVQHPGRYEVFWYGKNSEGYFVSSGIYLYQLTTTRKVQTRKLVYVK